MEFKPLPDKNLSDKAYRNFAFFESYFSNYIEGTRFEVDEAKNIIDTNKPLPARNDDSHDVLGTYYIVSNCKEMSITPKKLIMYYEIHRLHIIDGLSDRSIAGQLVCDRKRRIKKLSLDGASKRSLNSYVSTQPNSLKIN